MAVTAYGKAELALVRGHYMVGVQVAIIEAREAMWRSLPPRTALVPGTEAVVVRRVPTGRAPAMWEVIVEQEVTDE